MERREALKKTILAAGTTAVAPSLLTLLQACQREIQLDWKPVFLNDKEANLILSLVDTILPKTTTPGGLEMKVDQFIDLVIGKVFDENGQKSIVVEMKQFDQECKDKFGDIFSKLSSEKKAEMLREVEVSSGKFNGNVWGTPVGVQKPVGFYRTIKSIMLWGYFSSEEIGKNVLNYDPIPGEYKGCVPLEGIGNSWSL